MFADDTRKMEYMLNNTSAIFAFLLQLICFANSTSQVGRQQRERRA